MLFVIDIGNTNTVAGLTREGRIVRQWRIKTEAAMTADELEILYHNLFALASIDLTAIDGIVMASVVPQLESAYHACCADLFRTVPLVVVTSDTVAGLITIGLDNPAEVGADRLVNGIAAFHMCRTNAIVIDFGTAITFDCISARPEYLGGLIIPGLQVSVLALSEKAAKLPQIDLHRPPDRVIGTNTVAAMKSGVLFGYGAMIEGLIGKVKVEMAAAGHTDPVVIATGGMAPVLVDFAPVIDRVEPDLTLNGLETVYRLLDRR